MRISPPPVAPVIQSTTQSATPTTNTPSTTTTTELLNLLDARFMQHHGSALPPQMKELLHLLVDQATITSLELDEENLRYTVNMEKAVIGTYGSVGSLSVGPNLSISLRKREFSKAVNSACLSIEFAEDCMKGAIRVGPFSLSPTIQRMEFDDKDLCVATSVFNFRNDLDGWLNWFKDKITYSLEA